MMLERTRARRQALQILYQRDITGQDVRSILDTRSFSDEDGEPSDYCRQLVLGTEARQGEVDARIEATSQHWSLMRMPFVDRNILRLAVYEIMFEEDVPASVAINEAVELAKAYGGDDSPKFVNGVLGKIAELRGEPVPDDVTDDVEHEEGV
ncbi:MAG TPA: transcription antitermination factor NusB [Coriobacteriia bacterium]|nr:MAG: N utilization substance protein B-like protein [Actinobacteria bacterium 66_15]HAL29861.1 transcription antitermination factor NusB [Coriobacteriia bacterium]